MRIFKKGRFMMKVNDYTLDQLATFFGVSITTVDQWIATGRLKGVDINTESISDSATWLSVAGKQVSIREVVERYTEKRKTEINTIEMDAEKYEFERLKEIIMMINHFEERYGGAYEQIVMEKGDPDATDDWKWRREGKEWSCHLVEIHELPEMTTTKIKETFD
jgi:transposase